MTNHFSNTIDELRGLINWSASSCHGLLLAVSGGIDSMCMAELFAGLPEPLPFAVAHCNFGLRGEESDGDEALVRGWAAGHGVEIHVRKFDTVGYAREHGISIEMAARDLRYAWFEELCREHGYCAVAVAHNANDNAETLMLNLLRGAGMNGLAGMSLISRIPCCSSDAPSGMSDAPYLVRPLLQFTRKQIEGYAFTHKLAYRDDSTNASSEYRRNRLRNEVFPIFETINPSFVRTLNHSIGWFAEAGEIVSDYCREAGSSLVSCSGEIVSVDLKGLLAQKHWRYLLYFILDPYGFNSSVQSSVEDLLSSSRTVSGKIFSSASHVLNMERDHMVIRPLATVDSHFSGGSVFGVSAGAASNTGIMPVRGAGVYHFNGRSFRVEVLPRTTDMPLKQPDGVLVMDASVLKFPFVLRAWRSGDWFIPLGLRGKKKVSDFFTDLKFTALDKASAVVIVDTATPGLAESQHLAAVACLRPDDRYKLTPSTTSIIRISELF